MKLQNKVIIKTRNTSGIGRLDARKFALKNAKILLVGIDGNDIYAGKKNSDVQQCDRPLTPPIERRTHPLAR